MEGSKEKHSKIMICYLKTNKAFPKCFTLDSNSVKYNHAFMQENAQMNMKCIWICREKHMECDCKM